MAHIANDILLARVREQQLYLWTPQMTEHLQRCESCSRRYMELEETSDLLQAWGRSSAADAYYPPISTSVLRTIYESGAKPGAPAFGRKRSQFARVFIVPVALVMVLLSALLFAGLKLNIMPGSAGKPQHAAPTAISQHPETPSPTATVGQIRVTPTVVITPAATAVIVVGPSGSTNPVLQNPPQIAVESPCTTVIDVIQNQLHVCGKDFTSDTSVTIYYYIKGSLIKEHFTQVAANGTFNDMLYIPSCDNVPTSIYVQNAAYSQEVAKITKNIVFGTCQSFGGLKKHK